MTKVLITGPSGAGKSFLADELSRRAYKAYTTDDIPGLTRHVDRVTGQVTSSAPPAPIDFSRYSWDWNIPALNELLATGDPVFIAAWTGNIDENLHLFDHIFALIPSAEVAKQRIMSRPDSVNDFGKHPEELAEILSDVAEAKDYWRARGAVIIDANPPITEVADNILSLLKLPGTAP